ncbi:hypothetical protein IKL64_05185 [bacterium]|nr:hypothetical protein [bacterium]
MNKNIFSPKGKINQSFFIIYYVLLMTVYIIGGIALMVVVYKNNLNSLYFMWPLLLIKILLLFNYKKRLLDIIGNLPWAIVLAFLLTFDAEGLAACQLIKDPQISMITFFAAALFILFVQPAIIAVIPSKEIKE